MKYAEKNQLEVNKLVFEHYDNDFNPYINDELLKYWSVRAAIVNTQGRQLQRSTIEKFQDDYEFMEYIEELPELDEEDTEKDKQDDIDRGLPVDIQDVKKANLEQYYKNVMDAPLLEDIATRRTKEKTRKNGKGETYRTSKQHH